MTAGLLPLVIYGAGGHARVVADIVRLGGRFVLAGFLDDIHVQRYGSTFEGASILGGTDQLAELRRRGVTHAFVAVGDCAHRLTIGSMLSDLGFEMPVLTHPSAVVADGVPVGAGSVLIAGAIVNPGATLGTAVIVNTAASVDHDCVVDDGGHVACGARLAGGVRVGRGAWIGLGAVVKEGVRVGAGAMVGAGSVVLRDVPDGAVAYGCPARVVRYVTHAHSS